MRTTEIRGAPDPFSISYLKRAIQHPKMTHKPSIWTKYFKRYPIITPKAHGVIITRHQKGPKESTGNWIAM